MLYSLELFLMVAAALVFVSVMLVPLSARIGAPLLLIFLGIGMLMGVDGPGGVSFDDFDAAYQLGSLALAVILFSGGLEMPARTVLSVAAPAITLATIGVILTAGLIGMAASLLLGLSLLEGLLLGAVVGSTDAAATFLLIQQGGVKLPGRVKETLLVESGVNDPMAIFLTVVLTTLVDAGAPLSFSTLVSTLPDLVLQLGVGTVAGLAGGFVLVWVINLIKLPLGLYPILALAGALAIFSATALVGGSGFLAIYLCGIVITTRVKRSGERIRHFNEGLAWLSQIGMFLMLGLLVTPTELSGIMIPALGVAAILMFIARPAAVWACLGPMRFRNRERFYIGWVGLRGAVPIFLAIIPVISPGSVNVSFFNIVFVIVVASLVLQGWTIPSSARWLRVSGQRSGQGEPEESASG
ncbi:MAG: potassium/proton antiporter [Pseudomonadota bacterium]